MSNHDLEIIEQLLQQFVKNYSNESLALHAAIKYALLSPGKRVRARLSILTAEMFGAPASAAYSSALALEMIHAYSLIHDDLPCMDNDLWRRGQPSTHAKFGETTALLAGDSLLTDSFRVLTDQSFCEYAAHSADQKVLLVQLLSSSGGTFGMVGGQALDCLNATSGTLDLLKEIHLNKTAKLIAAATGMGAAASGQDRNTVDQIYNFGLEIGLCFQIIDDLLDDSHETGKSVGKDRAQGKLTYPLLMGREAAEKLADQMTASALARLSPYGEHAEPLKAFAKSLLHRVR